MRRLRMPTSYEEGAHRQVDRVSKASFMGIKTYEAALQAFEEAMAGGVVESSIARMGIVFCWRLLDTDDTYMLPYQDPQVGSSTSRPLPPFPAADPVGRFIAVFCGEEVGVFENW